MKEHILPKAHECTWRATSIKAPLAQEPTMSVAAIGTGPFPDPRARVDDPIQVLRQVGVTGCHTGSEFTASSLRTLTTHVARQRTAQPSAPRPCGCGVDPGRRARRFVSAHSYHQTKSGGYNTRN